MNYNANERSNTQKVQLQNLATVPTGEWEFKAHAHNGECSMKSKNSSQGNVAASAASRICRSFYDRSPVEVARDLLGKRLVSLRDQKLTSGIIVETEAYLAADDSASHSHRGPNRKNQAMYERPGTAYVYVIHARYCFNVVTEPIGVGSAVLIRALQPDEGIDIQTERRNSVGGRELCRGPARLCESLGITRVDDGKDLVEGSELWIEALTSPVELGEVSKSARIGVTSAHELKLRYYFTENQFVSGTKKLNSGGEKIG